MSDPVSNNDIDDVLSSIRRLVTQDGTKAEAASDAPSGDVPSLLRPPTLEPVDDAPVETVAVDDATIVPVSAQTPQVDRLVLTQALRVVEDNGDLGEPRNAFSNYEADMALMDAQEAALSVEAEPVEVVWDEDDAGQEDAPEDRDSLEATIAELEAAVSGTSGEWEPDGSEELRGLAGGLMMNSTTDTPTEQILAPDPVDDVAEVTDAEIAADEPAADAAVVEEPVADIAAEIEGAVVEEVSKDAWDVVASAIAGTTVAAKEVTFRHAAPDEVEDFGDELAVEAPVDEAPAKDAPQEPEITAETASDAPTFGADESMLRRLVVDIVREELQGEMGERITRNVRKLVRREIHRMLASRDFD